MSKKGKKKKKLFRNLSAKYASLFNKGSKHKNKKAYNKKDKSYKDMVNYED